MKQSTVRGTPIHSVKAGNAQGMNHGAKPEGMSGTVNRQFEGDQKINRQEGISTGTPYQSMDGNGPETRRVRSSDKFGKVMTPAAGDQAEHDSNGNGVLFDRIERSEDYIGKIANVMDSPVPVGAQQPQHDASLKLNELRNGQGKYWGADDAIEDSLLEADGVMSRGIDNTEDDRAEQKDEETKPFGFKRTAEDQQQIDDERG
jgi:hypothetical protein